MTDTDGIIDCELTVRAPKWVQTDFIDILSDGLFKSLLASYKRTAEDTIERYHADAAINGLEFDRDEEEKAVETFAHAITLAGEQFLKDPLGAPLIPNWNRVTAAIPGFLSSLSEVVEEDNKT